MRDIQRVRHMMPPKPADDLGSEHVFQKLGKSIIARTDIAPGDTITLDNLTGRIFDAEYVPVRESNQIIGRIAKRSITQGEPIQLTDLES